MNIFIGITAFVLCMILSYNKANKYVKKRQFYFDFYTFNKRLKTEIEFTQKTLTTLLNEYNENDFIDVFKNYIKTNVFKFDNNYLSEDDKNFYKNYLSIIGSGDRISQIQFIDKISEQIDIKYNDSQEEEKIYKKLYYKIGFLIGLMIFILFL